MAELADALDSGSSQQSGLIGTHLYRITTDQVYVFKRDLPGNPNTWIQDFTIGVSGGYAGGSDVRHPTTTNPEYDTSFKSNVRLSGEYWEDGDQEYRERAVLCYDKDGRLWVSDSATCRVLRFTSAGNHDGAVIAWQPKTYAMAIDPNEPNRVFNGYLEYEVNYSGDFFTGDSVWKLVNYWGFQVDRGNDLHNGIWSVHRYSNGKRYVVTYDPTAERRGRVMYLDETNVSGTQTTGTMAATGLQLGNALGIEAAFETDGSILSVAQSGSPNKAYFNKDSFIGFDLDGVTPLYSSSEVANVTAGTTDPVKRIWKDTSDDKIITFFNNGVTDAGPYTGWHLGAVSKSGNAWLWKTCPTATANGLGAFEIYQPNAQDVPFEVVGDNVFLICRGEFYRNYSHGIRS